MRRPDLIIALLLLAFTSLAILYAFSYNKTINQETEISGLRNQIKILQKDLSEMENDNQDLQKKLTALSELEKRSYHPALSAPDFSGGTSTESNGVATVVYRKPSCDYFILENSSGYIVAEWFGGNDPDLNDRITGSFNSFGFKDLYNQTRDTECRFWIDDYMLSKESALEKINEECQ